MACHCREGLYLGEEELLPIYIVQHQAHVHQLEPLRYVVHEHTDKQTDCIRLSLSSALGKQSLNVV